MQHTFKFGDVHITVDAPDDVRLIIGLATHANDADEYHAAVNAAGGLTAFNDVRTDIRWIDTPEQKAGKVTADLTVFVPTRIGVGVRELYPGMAKLRNEQQQAREAEVAS